jgi:hypothetical protein
MAVFSTVIAVQHGESGNGTQCMMQTQIEILSFHRKYEWQSRKRKPDHKVQCFSRLRAGNLGEESRHPGQWIR